MSNHKPIVHTKSFWRARCRCQDRMLRCLWLRRPHNQRRLGRGADAHLRGPRGRRACRQCRISSQDNQAGRPRRCRRASVVLSAVRSMQERQRKLLRAHGPHVRLSVSQGSRLKPNRLPGRLCIAHKGSRVLCLPDPRQHPLGGRGAIALCGTDGMVAARAHQDRTRI